MKEDLNRLIALLLVEEEAAVLWAQSYQPGGRSDIASVQEFGQRKGYVDGLRRAIDQASAIYREGTEIVAPPPNPITSFDDGFREVDGNII